MLVVSGVTTAPVEKPTPGSPALRVTVVAPAAPPPDTAKITDLVQSATAAYPVIAMGSGVIGRVVALGATSAVVYAGATRGTLERTTSTSLPCTGCPMFWGFA